MSAPVVPEGATLISTFTRSFVDVPIDAEKDNAISTTEFLEAADSLTTMFDALGSIAFSPVKSDMLGNIKKIRERQLAAPAESETLQALVLNELKSKSHKATEGLVWLVRGLDFTYIALNKNLANTSEELADSFRGAYGATLKPHHGMLVKPVFSAAMSACPYRKDFYPKLGADQAAVTAELGTYLAALGKIVGILKGFQERKEAKW
ncbi:glycolipid transfer protein domain-containing protein [Xylaria curta]|nr:glycolipid transfer protein domain-containing protein [Xylaria curta]